MCQNEDKNPSTEDSAEDSAIQQKTELADGGSLKTVVINMFKHLQKGSTFYLCMDPRYS